VDSTIPSPAILLFIMINLKLSTQKAQVRLTGLFAYTTGLVFHLSYQLLYRYLNQVRSRFALGCIRVRCFVPSRPFKRSAPCGVRMPFKKQKSHLRLISGGNSIQYVLQTLDKAETSFKWPTCCFPRQRFGLYLNL